MSYAKLAPIPKAATELSSCGITMDAQRMKRPIQRDLSGRVGTVRRAVNGIAGAGLTFCSQDPLARWTARRRVAQPSRRENS